MQLTVPCNELCRSPLIPWSLMHNATSSSPSGLMLHSSVFAVSIIHHVHRTIQLYHLFTELEPLLLHWAVASIPRAAAKQSSFSPPVCFPFQQYSVFLFKFHDFAPTAFDPYLGCLFSSQALRLGFHLYLSHSFKFGVTRFPSSFPWAILSFHGLSSGCMHYAHVQILRLIDMSAPRVFSAMVESTHFLCQDLMHRRRWSNFMKTGRAPDLLLVSILLAIVVLVRLVLVLVFMLLPSGKLGQKDRTKDRTKHLRTGAAVADADAK